MIFLYKNYNINQLALPLDLEIKLDEKDIVFAIHHLIESIPEEAFHSFKKEQGTTAIIHGLCDSQKLSTFIPLIISE